MSRITLTIAVPEHAAFKLLPRLVTCLHPQAPATGLAIRSYTARDDAITLLNAGEADVAIGVPPSSAPGRIFTRSLFDEPYVCVRGNESGGCAPKSVVSFPQQRDIQAVVQASFLAP